MVVFDCFDECSGDWAEESGMQEFHQVLMVGVSMLLLPRCMGFVLLLVFVFCLFICYFLAVEFN